MRYAYFFLFPPKITQGVLKRTPPSFFYVLTTSLLKHIHNMQVGIKFARGDLRSESGVGAGDGYKTHTDKWLQGRWGSAKSPMEMIAEAAPIPVDGQTAICCGGTTDPRAGHPAEYIKLYGTSFSQPAICKYCGLKYYSTGHGGHH